MAVRDDLDQILNGQRGVEHLVYGDLSTGMVLYAASKSQVGQEAHDALIADAVTFFGGTGAKLARTAGTESGDLHAIVADDKGATIYVRTASADETMILKLADTADLGGLCTIGAETLARLAGAEG